MTLKPFYFILFSVYAVSEIISLTFQNLLLPNIKVINILKCTVLVPSANFFKKLLLITAIFLKSVNTVEKGMNIAIDRTDYFMQKHNL